MNYFLQITFLHDKNVIWIPQKSFNLPKILGFTAALSITVWFS